MAENEFTVTNSTNISQVSFTHEHPGEGDGALVVVFTSGRAYRYSGVPMDVFTTLKDVHEAGGSVGRAFAQHVRSAGFEYEEV
ncbi:MAG TPA: KTSC domain-containing protein [Nitrospira sp.]|nr:KTSC domain-containing protein [Nitrospira sp.]